VIECIQIKNLLRSHSGPLGASPTAIKKWKLPDVPQYHLEHPKALNNTQKGIQMTIQVAGPGTEIDFFRAWNVGFKLFDGFGGDPLNKAIKTLDDVKVYDPEETYENRYHGMTRNDMASSVRSYIRNVPLFRGTEYRVYARYIVVQKGERQLFRFVGLEFVRAENVLGGGPSGPAVRLGTITI